jgi:glutamate-5-semialdehyde dehydrogenase
MNYAETLGAKAKAVSGIIASASTEVKNNALTAIAEEIVKQEAEIISANKKDLDTAKQNNMSEAMQDRLKLDSKRIESIANAVLELVQADDPVGTVDGGGIRPNGLRILKTRVPLGVIGIIYESRPNVTVDAAVLCLKAGNTVILRGGKEAFNSNKALVDIMRKAIVSAGLPQDTVQLVEDTSRETAKDLMQLNQYLDVLIPRGGAGLISTVIKESTVPVIETGVGNCHVYVEKSADLDMAVSIVHNAKTSRPSVCNSAESLLVDAEIAEKFLPLAEKALQSHNVELRGCERTCAILPCAKKATEDDFFAEFLDFTMSVKIVENVDEAIKHIAKYGTKHSEAIITQNLQAAEKFTQQVDAAAVYVNASTRFTDGGEFGMGAEIGIATQKLHARGPMGLRELTTIKYVINGNGQIR